jgi:hypothetical protein
VESKVESNFKIRVNYKNTFRLRAVELCIVLLNCILLKAFQELCNDLPQSVKVAQPSQPESLLSPFSLWSAQIFETER